MNSQLEKILGHKYSNDTLAHFYILEPKRNNTDEHCFTWLQNTLAKILNKERSHLINSQDIQILSAKDKKQYSAEDLAEIYKFTSYKAIELKRKFLIVSDLSKLTLMQSNKLLKTFEEPPIALTIFLLNDHKSSILKTIESRAIRLRIDLEKSHNENVLRAFLAGSQEVSYEDFDKFYTENYPTPKLCVIDLIDIANSVSVNDYNAIQKAFIALEQDMVYNNSISHMKLKIYALALVLKNQLK